VTPKIDLAKLEGLLSTEDFKVVKGIVATRGKNKGCLRKSKPTVTRTDVGFDNEGHHLWNIQGGKEAYVWRMVAFYTGVRPEMPVTAFYDLGPYTEIKELMEHLDNVVEVVLDSIPPRELRGAIRWGRALGMI